MTRHETVTSPAVLGAARQVSYCWLPFAFSNVGAQATNRDASSNRQWGAANFGGIAAVNVTTTGAPPAGDGLQLYLGRVTYAITSNTVPTGRILTPNFATNQAWVLPFQNVKGAASDSTPPDDCAVWSISLICAFDALPGAVTGDIGLTLGVGTRAEIRGTAAFAGIIFGPSNTGVISLFCRQADGGAVTFNQAAAGAPDMTKFHRYELRLLSATAASEARLKAMIDGVTYFNLPWGAGTVLPDQQLGGAGNIGLTAAIINKNATAAGTARIYCAHRGLVICSANDENSLP